MYYYFALESGLVTIIFLEVKGFVIFIACNLCTQPALRKCVLIGQMTSAGLEILCLTLIKVNFTPHT